MLNYLNKYRIISDCQNGYFPERSESHKGTINKTLHIILNGKLIQVVIK